MNDTAAVAETPDVAKVRFDDLRGDPAAKGGEVNLDVILDVPVTLAMEVGRTRISIRNLMALNQGSVVELDLRVLAGAAGMGECGENEVEIRAVQSGRDIGQIRAAPAGGVGKGGDNREDASFPS